MTTHAGTPTIRRASRAVRQGAASRKAESTLASKGPRALPRHPPLRPRGGHRPRRDRHCRRHRVALHRATPKLRSGATREGARSGVRVSVTTVKTTAATREVTLPGDFTDSRRRPSTPRSAAMSPTRRTRASVYRNDVLDPNLPENEKRRRDRSARLRDCQDHRRAQRPRLRRAASSGPGSRQRGGAAGRHPFGPRTARAVFQYTTLRALFDGVVTARYVDPGALVAAASGDVDLVTLR